MYIVTEFEFRPGEPAYSVHEAGTPARPTTRWNFLRSKAEAMARKLNGEAPKPKAAKTCPECGTKHHKKGRFCCDSCRMDAAVRERRRGTQAVKLMQAWRKGRHVKGGSAGYLSEMARLADDWNREDADRAKAIAAAKRAK